MSFLSSLLLGALLGAVNAAAAVVVARRASALGLNQALGLVLGSMMLRMLLVLVAFGVLLAVLPVHRGGLVTGLGVLFALGLAAEVAVVLRRASSSSAEAPSVEIPTRTA